MSLSLIAAVAENHCIGKDNKLPWHIPEDMRHFKELTLGKIVLMGRKTWESLPEKFRPLPQRTNVILTRQEGLSVPEGVEVVHTLDEALSKHANEEVLVIGGAQLYQEAMSKADTLLITEVHQSVDGDAFFPDIDKTLWKEMDRQDFPTHSFVTYKHL